MAHHICIKMQQCKTSREGGRTEYDGNGNGNDSALQFWLHSRRSTYLRAILVEASVFVRALVVVNRGGKRGTFVLRLATGVACPPADGQCEVGITG